MAADFFSARHFKAEHFRALFFPFQADDVPVPEPDSGFGAVGGAAGWRHSPARPTWASRIYDLIHVMLSPHYRFARRFEAAMTLAETPGVEAVIPRKKLNGHIAELWMEWPEKFDELSKRRAAKMAKQAA